VGPLLVELLLNVWPYFLAALARQLAEVALYFFLLQSLAWVDCVCVEEGLTLLVPSLALALSCRFYEGA
jgi:hypothetical protein